MSKIVDPVVDGTPFVDNHQGSGIGSRMKAVREHLGLTQEGLAKAVGGSKRGIQENETRNRVPGGEVIAGLVRAGINANWLLTGDGPMLLADLLAQSERIREVPEPINTGALAALIRGAIALVEGGVSVEKAAKMAANMYSQLREEEQITPTGIGEGRSGKAA